MSGDQDGSALSAQDDSVTYRLLKIAHLLGFATFLGSVLSHIVAGFAGGEPGAASFLFARENILSTNQVLTIPGLVLTLASGLALMVAGRLSPLRHRWLAIHAGLAIAVSVVAVAILLPAGEAIADEAAALVQASDPAAVAQVLNRSRLESVVGAINIVLTLAVVSVGVLKPALQTLPRRSTIAK